MSRLPNRPLLLLYFLLACWASAAGAHSSLFFKEENVHSYTATFSASADAPKLYAGYAATYVFELFDANKISVPYDVAYAEFSTKDGVILFSGQLPGPKGLMLVTTFDFAVPAAGDYLAEVTFIRNAAGSIDQLAKARFNFSAVENPADEPPRWQSRYLWGAISLVLGLFGGTLWARYKYSKV
jgi:hypothetical protein